VEGKLALLHNKSFYLAVTSQPYVFNGNAVQGVGHLLAFAAKHQGVQRTVGHLLA
jgi:hypothetical protein